MTGPATLVEMLRRRAEGAPTAEAFTFLGDGAEEVRVTYAQLDARARAIAGLLRRRRRDSEERAVLLYPPGRDYVEALFGCLYAGVVAVPAYPPDPARLNRTVPRLLSILADARAAFVLTTEAIEAAVPQLFAETRVPAAEFVATDVDAPEEAENWKPPKHASDSLAILQYTSGSTASPRGVMLAHRHLLRNSEFIARAFGHSKDSRGVIWLPPYHDMGLIGGVLQPVFVGFPCLLMSPLTFLRRPHRWLEAVSRYRATTSGGPNFAFDLCARRVPHEQRSMLDLSTWELAFNGSEPVRETTVEAFAEAFGPCGFRREAFYPCYGLAEGTLMVTGGRKLGSLRTFRADAVKLDHEALAEPPGGQVQAKTIVGCGRSDVGHEVAIVDPTAASPVGDGGVGEIWVRGPSVAAGYWDRPVETAATFEARLSDGRGPFLRTGDLGFLLDGELFVTGRAKDLIVVAGRNYYPFDIELACDGVEGVRRNCGAAFTFERGGREGVAVVYEVVDEPGVHLDAVVDGIRQGVARALDVQVQAVTLIKPRTIPKTSSGKVQRWVCRAMFEEGSLEPLAEWSLDAAVRQPHAARAP
jgi:acyl-CoA synthetase (AMP-forming)/AMP-acid ligase II